MTADSAPINLTHHFLIAMPGMEEGAFAKSVVYVCEHTESGALGIVINKPSELSLQSLFEKVSLTLRRADLMDCLVMQGGPMQTERGFVLHDALWANQPTQTTPAQLAQTAAPINPVCQATPESNRTTVDKEMVYGQEASDQTKEPKTATALNAVEAAQAAIQTNPTSDRESVYASTLSMSGGLEMTTSKDVLEALSMGAGPKRVLISLGYSAWGEGQLESELAENSWLTVGADASVIFDTPVEQRYARAMQLLGLEPWMLSQEVGHS